MTQLGTLIERLAAWWALAAGFLIVLIATVTSVNAGAFLLDRLAALVGADVGALPGYEDFVQLTVSCAALMFMPYAQVRHGHVTVELFAQLMNPRLRAVLDRLAYAAMAAATLFLCYWMAIGVAQVRGDEALSPILGWVIWPFYLPGIASLALWAIVAALQLAGWEASESAEREPEGPVHDA